MATPNDFVAHLPIEAPPSEGSALKNLIRLRLVSR